MCKEIIVQYSIMWQWSNRLSVDDDVGLLEVLAILLVHQHQVDRVLDGQSVVDVFVGGRQLHSIHEHPDGHELALVRAPVHHLVLHKVLGFRFGRGACPESLLPDQVDLHELYFELDKVEQHLA